MKKNILVLLLFPFIVFSQQWTEDLQNPNKNFYEISAVSSGTNMAIH